MYAFDTVAFCHWIAGLGWQCFAEMWHCHDIALFTFCVFYTYSHNWPPLGAKPKLGSPNGRRSLLILSRTSMYTFFSPSHWDFYVYFLWPFFPALPCIICLSSLYLLSGTFMYTAFDLCPHGLYVYCLWSFYWLWPFSPGLLCRLSLVLLLSLAPNTRTSL